jgi:hypothetical protein
VSVRHFAALLACACALAAGLACATSGPPTASDVPACQGLASPRVVGTQRVDVPATFATARLTGELPAQVTVAADGTVRDSAMRTGDLPALEGFVRDTLKHTRFSAGSFEGNAAAVRVPVQIPIGSPRRPDDPRGPAEVWAHVAAGQSREARWQLRDSVTWVTVTAHAPKLAAPGAEIVAVAPDGRTKTLVKLKASNSPQDVRQIVAAEKFFDAAGTYRLELRSSKVLSAADFTIAEDYRAAVINACEPLTLPRKTGPGN